MNEYDVYDNPEDLEMDNPWGDVIPYMIESNPRSSTKARKAMKRAGQLRAEGLSQSEALSLAWDEIREGRSNPMDNPFEASPILLLALAAGAGALIYKRVKGMYPWEAGGLFGRARLGTQKLLGNPNPVVRPGNPGNPKVAPTSLPDVSGVRWVPHTSVQAIGTIGAFPGVDPRAEETFAVITP